MENVVDIEIANFPLRFGGLPHEAALLLIDKAVSLVDILKDVHQRDDGLPNVEEIRRVVR